MAQKPDAPKPYWQLWQSQQDRLWYFHLVAANHKRIVWAEGYERREGAEEALKWVKYWADKATGP